MVELWKTWEGRTINGVFPLRRFLNASDHSAVFLTESAAEGFLNAAVKIVPAVAEHSELQLWHWKTAITFSHPNLVRLLDCGQCQIDERPFLFVVMEYAEESLSQILPYRALGADEVRELLVPTLAALAFLHNENWVQGQLKPANFLVVDDQLKLATDTIRPIAVSRAGISKPTIYDPPEAEEGNVSAAGDIWALGVTMVEALTQYPPTWLSGRSEPPSMPTNLPQEFADTVQRCLSRDPAKRPTIAELQTHTIPSAPAPVAPSAAPSVRATPSERALAGPAVQVRPREPAIRADPRPFSELGEESKRGFWVPAVAVLVIAGVVWWGLRLFGGQLPGTAPGAAQLPAVDSPLAAPDATSTAMQPPTPAATEPAPPVSPPARKMPAAPAPAVAPASSKARSVAAADTDSAVVHEEIPKVPLSARNTIHGRIKVGVRVTVDNSGRVVGDSLDRPGPSRYFNRLASEAARKWKFASTDRGPREWVLRFEFGRDGTTAQARPKS